MFVSGLNRSIVAGQTNPGFNLNPDHDGCDREDQCNDL
jgi:hypothetical protein